jgi:ankyrin repeat protein
MGTTPLHVAVLFGHTAIIRYLAGRFTETLQARDNSDRTPLHYAATMADNGHYYNLLLKLGADPALKDNVSSNS